MKKKTKAGQPKPQPRPAFQPLYLQIKQRLIQRVLTGEWRPAQMLPSEMKLAEEYQVSQGTVRKAIEEMAAENLVMRHQGKGTFVATHRSTSRPFRFIRLVSDISKETHPATRYISIKSGLATAEERKRLRLPVDGRVVRAERVRSFGGQPCVYDRLVLCADGMRRLEQVLDRIRPDSVYSALEQEYHLLVVRIAEQLRAIPASATDAKMLKVAVGHPLLEVDRTALSLDQRIVEWRVSRCDTRYLHYANEQT
ncbi:MAG TPA: GntR family transcriptional regulator [Dongiaceae bacterium]|jgi:GntR family transcriptional regulator|nr:GntR family transcriptional regulator [Dongiaceae bacterium]